jgi:hypothetical protein
MRQIPVEPVADLDLTNIDTSYSTFARIAKQLPFERLVQLAQTTNVDTIAQSADAYIAHMKQYLEYYHPEWVGEYIDYINDESSKLVAATIGTVATSTVGTVNLLAAATAANNFHNNVARNRLHGHGYNLRPNPTPTDFYQPPGWRYLF